MSANGTRPSHLLVGTLLGAGLLLGFMAPAMAASKSEASSLLPKYCQPTHGALSHVASLRCQSLHVMVLRPHVMVLMMENQSFSDIIANPSAPYQNQLARSYKTATNYYGVGHYSLDNYLAAITGNFYAWSTGDCSPGPGCQSSDATLANQLDAAGIPWDAYMGSMPTDCDTSNYDNGTVGHSYGVRHNPFVYFPDLVKTDCARDQPSANMLGALDAANPPDFVWYSPQICDDGGGDDACATIAAGDRFLSREIPAIERTPWYKHGGVVVLTYDEGDSMGQGQGEHLTGEGNHLLTVVISAATAGKPDYTAYVNHFGLLASIEKAFGLGCMNQACTASNGHLALS